MGVKKDVKSLKIHLEGNNLASRHKHYNALLKKAIDDENDISTEIDYEDNDIDNLFKIDIACKRRDVDYILEALKCEDMLYISRAIKRSLWLLTDQQYAHIINPEYLETEMFPHMTSKAINKLMLHVRLNLKDESRVEDFYKHYEKININTALKWLLNCSQPFIENELVKHGIAVNASLISRICKKYSDDSLTILSRFLQNLQSQERYSYFNPLLYLLKKDANKYLDIIEFDNNIDFPSFDAKATKIIMKSNPERIMNNFEKYANYIHAETFAKHLKNVNIKEFINHYMPNKSVHWFGFENIKRLVNNLPKEERFSYVKAIFIDKTTDNLPIHNVVYCSPSSNANVYLWYQFADFNTAFTDLKKMIRLESSPDERNAMLEILLTVSANHPPHIHTLLNYHYERHINEAFKFKSQFITKVVQRTDITKYKEETWSIINKIFRSMEVYIESTNDVQLFVESIILYNLLHNINIPQIIEAKFVFNSLIGHKKKISAKEEELVFNYLFSLIQTKVNQKNLHNETEFIEAIALLQETLALLVDWKKEFLDYPWIQEKFSEIIKSKEEKAWGVGLVSLFYSLKKSWRKYLFKESLVVNSSEETFLNAIKHDSELLGQYKNHVDQACSDDNVPLKRLLNKLRVYWPETLSKEIKDAYYERLDQGSGYKAVTLGLCTLLPRVDLFNLLEKYKPNADKINWSETDEVMLSLQKAFSKNMHKARPQPKPEAVFMFARGDYFQYVLPSLDAVFHNLSKVNTRHYLKKLLEAPVSLQKHGIRIAFKKLSVDELKTVATDLWNTTKNPTIRAVLFKETQNLLCNEKTMIKEIWKILSVFIHNLSEDDNKDIIETMRKVKEVPIELRSEYCMQCYTYLKSLPAKSNCESVIYEIQRSMTDIMELLDPDYVANMLNELYATKYNILINYFSESFVIIHLLTSYLLCANNEREQMERFEKVFLPVLKLSIEKWNDVKDNELYMRKNLENILFHFLKEFNDCFQRLDKIVFPVKVFTKIQDELEALPTCENYVIQTTWKLTIEFLKIMEKNQSSMVKTNDDNVKTAVDNSMAYEFGKKCSELLKKDVETYFSSIYLLFAKSLRCFFGSKHTNEQFEFITIKSIIDSNDITKETCLLALDFWPDIRYQDKAKEMYEKMISNPSDEIKFHYYRTTL